MPGDETALLYQISRQLNSDLDIDRVLADALHLTVQYLRASNGSIMILDETGMVVHKILARQGMRPEQAEAVVTNVLAQGLAGWVVDHGEGCIIDDVLSDKRWVSFSDDSLVGGSAISVPLLRQDRAIGVLTLRHREPHHFGQTHLELLSSIADQATIAVQNARLFHSVQAERARMEAIITGAGDAILVTDQQGRLLLMNAIARQAFGVPTDGELQDLCIGDLVPNPSLGELWAHREDTGYPSTGEVPLGNRRTFHASLTSVPNVGYVVIMQDITDLKELNEMKTEFVSVVSHDLRSPLQLICTYAGMVGEAGPINDQQRQYLDGINRGVQKMADLIGDLLDLAKVEAGVDMERQVCHMDRLIGQVVQRFQRIAQDHGVTLYSELPDDLPPVQASVHRVDQVLSNLIDNAIKYTPQGTVTVRASADDHQVAVYVTDSGIGLKPQEQKEVFNRFYRAQNELTAHIEGTGLGLAITRSIVEQHGGRIWVQSTWQRGSTFAFSLPRDERG